jgi:hypothetical protein
MCVKKPTDVSIYSTCVRWGGCTVPRPVSFIASKDPVRTVQRLVGPRGRYLRYGKSCPSRGSNPGPSVEKQVAVRTTPSRPQFH